MNPKDVSYNWLSSGGAYFVIFAVWLVSAFYFASIARSIGRESGSPNDGCLLSISTTVFVVIGGAIGLLIINRYFPWFIFTSTLGAIVGPSLTIRAFKSGRRKY